MTTVLLVLNEGPEATGGHAEVYTSRIDPLADRGIDLVFGVAPPPYVLRAPLSLLAICWLGWREDVDVVHSVSNPFHLQVLGYLASRLLGVPWIVEFRDPMVEIPDREPGAPTTRLAAAVERLAVERADHVVWIDGIQLPDDYFQRRYGTDPDRVTKLPFMGYDRATFEGVEPVEYDRFTVTYAGSFYEGWIEPDAVLAALGEYCDGADRDLRVQFYGDWDPEYDRQVADLGLEDVVEHHDFVPHEEIVPVLKGSDALLYVGGTDPRNELNVPSKIYDYVGAGAPILAVVDPDFRVADVVRDHELGVVADPRDPSAIRDAIERLHRGDVDLSPDRDRFTRDRHVRTVGDVIERVAGEASP